MAIATPAAQTKSLELVCPAGNLPSLKTAVDNGADSVYLGFRDDTNARHFPGLNFDAKTAAQGIHYAHAKGRRVFVALNTFPQPAGWERWQRAVDRAAELGADAIIAADISVLDQDLTIKTLRLNAGPARLEAEGSWRSAGICAGP